MSEFDTRTSIEESELYRMAEVMAELNKLREQEEAEEKNLRKN